MRPWKQHFDVEEKGDDEDKNKDIHKYAGGDKDENKDEDTNNLECLLVTLCGVKIHDEDTFFEDAMLNEVTFEKFSKGYQIDRHPLRLYTWGELSAGNCQYFVDGVLPLLVAIEISYYDGEWDM